MLIANNTMHFFPLRAFLPLLLFVLNPLQAQNIVVTNANNSGDGSLRDAIATAPDETSITFDAELNGDTIQLNSQLPETHS